MNSPSPFWNQSEAIALCVEIEKICPPFGCHVALTGGLLYKQGERKDCDILFYRIRQVEKIDFDNLWIALESIGFQKVSGFGWCYKAIYNGKKVDCFSPEESGSHMGNSEADKDDAPIDRELEEKFNSTIEKHTCKACDCLITSEGCGCNPVYA
jgi:hypothetical protein